MLPPGSSCNGGGEEGGGGGGGGEGEQQASCLVAKQAMEFPQVYRLVYIIANTHALQLTNDIHNTHTIS